jgi:hypothetical protein
MKPIHKMTEEQFYDNIVIEENHIDTNASFGGNMFETFGEEFDYVVEKSLENKVITIIEGENDELYYVSGLRYINRIGYFVSENPIDIEFEVKVD